MTSRINGYRSNVPIHPTKRKVDQDFFQDERVNEIYKNSRFDPRKQLVHYNKQIRDALNSNNLQRAIGNLQTIESGHLTPDAYTYTPFIKYYGQNGLKNKVGDRKRVRDFH